LWSVKQILKTDRGHEVLPIAGTLVNGFQTFKISVGVLK